MRSPTLSFFAGRTKARQRQSSTRLMQRRFDRRDRLAPDANAVEPRRDHPRIVDDERVAGAQVIGQIADAASSSAPPAPTTSSRALSRGDGRAQRDALRGQFEIEGVDAHVVNRASEAHKHDGRRVPGLTTRT